MKVFFDNCTAPVFASTLDGYIRFDDHRAYHIKDVPGLAHGRNATDLEWINYLRSAGEPWIFVTGDGRVLKNPAERAALRSAGLHGFVLAPAYQITALNADSDEAAQAFRFDGAQCSDVMSPRARRLAG